MNRSNQVYKDILGNGYEFTPDFVQNSVTHGAGGADETIAGARASLLCAGLAFWLYDQGLVRLAYPNASRYPVRGVDVSHHQGQIDWTRLERNLPAVLFRKG